MEMNDMKNICLVRQDESAGELNIALGEITFGRGPLTGVSTIDLAKVQNICCFRKPNLT
jgi:hypothetical protein